MALVTCELMWIKQLIEELKFVEIFQMKVSCDNQAILHIVSNLVFNEKTKHIEVDCHFIREKVLFGCIVTNYINTNNQLVDILTKSLRGPCIGFIYNKIGAYNLYTSA